MRRARHLAAAAVVLVAALPPGNAVAMTPLAPAEGAVVGPRLFFRIDAPELDERARSRAPLRIELLDEAGATVEIWERRARPSGWALGEGDEVVFTPRRPLPDGGYRWRLDAWDGATWVAGETVRFRVDSLPPAAVGGLTLALDRATGVVIAEWRPVAADVAGGAELVARYRVYAGEPGSLRPTAATELASAERERVELSLAALEERGALVGVRVQAQDAAGNEAGRRD